MSIHYLENLVEHIPEGAQKPTSSELALSEEIDGQIESSDAEALQKILHEAQQTATWFTGYQRDLPLPRNAHQTAIDHPFRVSKTAEFPMTNTASGSKTC